MEFKDSPFHRILEKDIPEVSASPEGIRSHFASISRFIAGIPAHLSGHAYAEGKWTIAQVLGHLIDTQAVFLYRLLSIARGDTAKLPGFDEGVWVANGKYGASALKEILALYDAAAAHTASAAIRLRKEDLARKGEANGVRITAEEVLIYLMAHELHHVTVLRERYIPG
jgi:uncharacterized damage-inducible protein DinB